MTNVFGYNTDNQFNQSLNTDDSVSFASVTVSEAITEAQQVATKLYVDTHGGGGGGGNMSYTGSTPATNILYKALASDGHDAIASTISDNGTTVVVSSVLKCNSLDGASDSGNLQIGNTQDTIDIIATNGLTANKVTINAGTNQEYMMADGSLLTSSGNAGNANFYLYNNVNGISVPPPSNGLVEYNATTLATTTIVYISHRTRDNIDIDVYLALINTLNDLYLQDQENSTNFAKFNIISAPTLIPNSYISIPVTQSDFGGNGNTAFGAGHNILVSFFSNTPEIDSRLSTLELRTQNQSAVSQITTFNNQVNTSILRVQAIYSETVNPFDRVTIGTGNDTVGITSLNGVTSKKFTVESGLSTQFLKGDGSLDSNTYALASSVTGIIQGMPFNSLYGNTTTAITGTRSLWYIGITPYSTTINGITIYVDGGGSDLTHFGIYRGYLKAGVGTNPGLNMTLVGQSTAGALLTTGIPFNRVPITAISGQNLNFTSGQYLTIAFHTSGVSNTFLSSPTAGSSFANLCFTTLTNYANTTFPTTITNSAISSPSTQRLCFDLY